MKILIAESSYPDDFYKNNLDGRSVSSLLDTIHVPNKLLIALDKKHLERAIFEMNDGDFNILHLSCHGDSSGIALSNNEQIDWDEFSQLFQDIKIGPTALVMSSCCGAASGICRAFAKKKIKPKIIFGSTEELNFSEYATAWAILYHRFKMDGVKRSAAIDALSHITAIVHESFVYRRWDGAKKRYLTFPATGVRYVVTETPKDK